MYEKTVEKLLSQGEHIASIDTVTGFHIITKCGYYRSEDMELMASKETRKGLIFSPSNCLLVEVSTVSPDLLESVFRGTL